MSSQSNEINGMEAARDALASMDARGIAPAPECYAVWMAYHRGDNPSLSRDIDQRETAGEAVDDAFCVQLYDTHFGHMAVGAAISESGAKIDAGLTTAISTLKDAGESQRRYGATLETAQGQFDDLTDPQALKDMVESLQRATEDARRHSEELERKLKETTNEVQELRSNLESVREEALTDGLTGVANRKRFDEALARAAADAAETGEPLSLIMGDIDHFKSFNDKFGHQTGDQIIRFVARTMANVCAGRFLVARYGGEEFAIVLNGAPREEARAIAEQIRATIEAKKLMRKSTNEDLGNVTISLGVGEYRESEFPATLIERTDECLYASKAGGRNQVTTDAEASTAPEQNAA